MITPNRVPLPAALGVLVALCGLAGPMAAGSADCPADRISLRTPEDRIINLRVEIADDPAERARGLMGRKKLPSAEGMLFVYPAPQTARFWMKDTLIALDMLFIDARGEVRQIHPDARPQDLTPISSTEKVQYVLEINGGLSAALGLVHGTVIRHPALAAATALWPCE